MDDITSRQGAEFIADSVPAAKVPAVISHADLTNAYLVALAKAHLLKLATLDANLCGKAWAKEVAENPL